MEVSVMNKILTKELYLELLKKTILHEIWLKSETDREIRRQGLDWPEHAHSMIGRLRMENIQHCMESVLKNGVEGDFIETGVWRGGACIFMRGLLKANEINNRRVWVADSFEGLPKPNETKYPIDKNDPHHTFNFLKVSLEEVKENFRRYDLLDEQVCFLKGWFEDTLPTAPIEKLAVLRLDGDMYGSTMDSLRNLYPKVSKGGFIIIDDYGLPNCVAAVTDFRKKFEIVEPLIRIDTFGVYWIKMK
jgi:O-methyltransferase